MQLYISNHLTDYVMVRSRVNVSLRLDDWFTEEKICIVELDSVADDSSRNWFLQLADII